MTSLRLTVIGVVAAVLMCAGVAFAANPGTANRTTPGSTSFSATVPGRFVNATLSAAQFFTFARTTVTVTSRNTNNYGGSAQIRCNGNAQIFVDGFGGTDTQGQITCSTTGNAFAGTIFIN